MEYKSQQVDVAVIGGGHAGIEAALASARLGLNTAVFSMSLDFIGNLPCNPSIGGTAKGHLVREIDALGGEMGKAADHALIQSRMLNRGKGPAVHSLRIQADRTKYHNYTKQALENQPNLNIIQAEIVKVSVDKNNRVNGVVSALDTFYPCKAVVLCTGTFLGAKIFVGEKFFHSGPDGLHPANKLTESLKELGHEIRRFKTGTPARVHADSIDYSKLEEQPGEDPVIPFSFGTTEKLENKRNCYIAYTNEDTHDIIRKNIRRSAMYSGNIEGTGARYCPSIEDKIVRFADKKRHQIFLEPMGLETKEMYLQGLSTSLPLDLQFEVYRSIKGFENIQLMRNAYAIEYDCINPIELKPTLESKIVSGLFCAGQINGTSGYEEAASQGLIAGTNAVQHIKDKTQVILPRSSSYIGTLIDDLVTKGTNEPYRMMTSRSEYRLLLRQDNADERLTPLGREIGLIGDERWEMFHVKQDMIKAEKKRISKITMGPSKELNDYLESKGTSAIDSGVHFEQLLRRPQLDYKSLGEFDNERPDLPDDVMEQVEVSIKYAGYIEKQLQQVNKARKLDETPLPEDINYKDIKGIRIEAREKLDTIRPASVGQASRISGVSPADISVLLIYMEQQRRQGKNA